MDSSPETSETGTSQQDSLSGAEISGSVSTWITVVTSFKRGVGTQVVQSPVHRRVELTSLFDDLARAGQEPTTRLLEREQTQKHLDTPGTRSFYVCSPEKVTSDSPSW